MVESKGWGSEGQDRVGPLEEPVRSLFCPSYIHELKEIVVYLLQEREMVKYMFKADGQGARMSIFCVLPSLILTIFQPFPSNSLP
jgi:hypothetical protein